jgi:hypothetical protein
MTALGTTVTPLVVVRHVIGNQASGVFQGQRHLDADTLAFDGLVIAFELAVGLGIIRRSTDMGHAGDADEFFEVLGDELGSVVADDAWVFAGELFSGALQDRFHVDFLHFFANLPVDEEAAVAVENAAQEVEGAGDVQVADIDVPVLVRPLGLHEAGALA